MSKTRVGCQPIIFNFGEHKDKYDWAGRLQAIADAGYAGYEGGPPGNPEAEAELRRLHEQTKLSVLGSHMSFPKLEEFGVHVNFLHEFGASLLMISGTGDRAAGARSYANAAKVLNEHGKQAAAEGLTFCYHNHSWEFKETFDEGSGMDILLARLDPEHVKLCVDTYWVHDGGVDPAAFLEQWAGRIGCLHLKDHKDGTFSEVGDGDLDFPAIFRAVEPLELPWVVVEKDRTTIDPAESIRRSRSYLREKIGI